jgi:hypothetical protein
LSGSGADADGEDYREINRDDEEISEHDDRAFV